MSLLTAYRQEPLRSRFKRVRFRFHRKWLMISSERHKRSMLSTSNRSHKTSTEKAVERNKIDLPTLSPPYNRIILYVNQEWSD